MSEKRIPNMVLFQMEFEDFESAIKSMSADEMKAHMYFAHGFIGELLRGRGEKSALTTAQEEAQQHPRAAVPDSGGD